MNTKDIYKFFSLEPAFLLCEIHPFLFRLPLRFSSLSLAKVRLSLTLTPPSRSRQMALFLFLSAKAALAFLLTAHFVALRPLFPFWQAQYVQVFPLKSVPFCQLFAGPGSPNESATFFLLLWPCSLFRFFSNIVAGTVFSLLLYYQATMGSRTLVSPGKQRS